MAGQPRNIRFDDDIYSALMQCVAKRRSKGEDIDFTKLVNESLRMLMPIHTWDDLSDRVSGLEQEVIAIKKWQTPNQKEKNN